MNTTFSRKSLMIARGTPVFSARHSAMRLPKMMPTATRMPNGSIFRLPNSGQPCSLNLGMRESVTTGGLT